METVLTLEELIRDRAEKGEFVHLSLWHEISSGLWAATYAPAHEFGNNIARDADPVKACEAAILMPKTKRKGNPNPNLRGSGVTAAVIENYKPDDIADETPMIRPAEPEKSDTLDSWLPRA